MIRRALETLDEGSSVMIFPEGTRSPNGRMRAFKPGAFEIALTAKRAVLPIAVQGTARALPKRGAFVLCCYGGALQPFVGRYKPDRKARWSWWAEDHSARSVTHWMPLPPLPVEEGRPGQ
jgi:1-acyl-sn-glycerol-3-phosphate acyltransferase